MGGGWGVSLKYSVFSPGAHLLEFRLCASPCWTRWQVGTKRNEPLVNITWHRFTNRNKRGWEEDTDTDSGKEVYMNKTNKTTKQKTQEHQEAERRFLLGGER